MKKKKLKPIKIKKKLNNEYLNNGYLKYSIPHQKWEKKILTVQQLKAKNKLIVEEQILLSEGTGLVVSPEQGTIENISINT